MPMPMPFDEFKKSCADHGYISRVTCTKSIFIMFTKNGIKTEIKANNYTIGYGRTQDELDILEEEMKRNDFPIKSRNKGGYINIAFQEGVSILDRFWKIVEIEENIDAIVAKAHGVGKKVFSKEESESRLFGKIADRYFFALEKKDQDMLDIARNLLSGDSHDDIITLGESVARTNTDTYREHIVPCILIHNRAIEMVQNGAGIVEVALMIKNNLGIVLISNEEQRLLDVTLGWRTTMPEGWKFGDNPLARLQSAGIRLK